MRYPLLTVVLLASCRDKPPPAAPPPPRDGVVVVQPGAEPRQVLRYQLTQGAKSTSELVVDVDIKNGEQSGPMPTQILDLETTVVDVGADGTAHLRIAVIDARVVDRADSQVSSAILRTQSDALRGLVITQTLAADGAVSDARLADGASASKLKGEVDTVLHGLEQVAMRLPAEPVGPGATWRERRTVLPEAGIRAVSEVTYTLAQVTGTTITYAGTGSSSGPPQKIERDGVQVEVTDTHGQSTVQGSIDLTHYAADASASSTFATTMAVLDPGTRPGTSAGAGPGAGRSTIEIAITSRLAPAAPRPAAPAVAEQPAAEPEPTAVAAAPPARAKPQPASRKRAQAAPTPGKRAGKRPPPAAAEAAPPSAPEAPEVTEPSAQDPQDPKAPLPADPADSDLRAPGTR